MKTLPTRDWPGVFHAAATLLCIVIFGAILYWAQLVLIPVALAILLTFVLSPIITRLERMGVPRAPAVVLTMLVVAASIGGALWSVFDQTSRLANDLPSYRQNILEKVAGVRAYLRGGAVEKVKDTLDDVQEELERENVSAAAEEQKERPVLVRVTSAEGQFITPDGIAPAAQAAATAGLVVVLSIFMLLKREDLLNRTVSLTGQRSLAPTTKALQEAGRRISRYLLMQFLINVSFGVAVTVGTSLIGVPYSILWGVCAAVFRYVPYIGPWVAALLPMTVSMVVFPTWTPLLLVAGLFVVLELVSNNVLEPWLYGRSVGLSELAVILAAVFWAWMWGSIGLILATPVTVCLVVLGKNIPALNIFDRLLGDGPALPPHMWLYQRLLSRDEEDAEEIIQEYLENNSPEAAADNLLLPALSLVRRERAHGRISPDDELYAFTAMGNLIEEHIAPGQLAMAHDFESLPHQLPLVMGLPLSSGGAPALQLLNTTLGARCQLEILSPEMLIAEWIAAIDKDMPACVILSSLGPGDLTRTRLICRRLRQSFPQLKMVVGRWDKKTSTKAQTAFKSAGADGTGTCIEDMTRLIIPIVQFHAISQPKLAAVAVS